MPANTYVPLASLSGRLDAEKTHGERTAKTVIAEFEAVFRAMSNAANHEFHVALRLLEELKRHPDIDL